MLPCVRRTEREAVVSRRLRWKKVIFQTGQDQISEEVSCPVSSFKGVTEARLQETVT